MYWLDTRSAGRFLVALLVVGIVIGTALFFYRPRPSGQPPLPEKQITVPSGRLTVEIADSEGERHEGLSDRPSLAQGRGMLFILPSEGVHPFWMYHMRFPIDIVYLRSGVIQEIFPQVPPPKQNELPKTVTPTQPADQVLEVYGGESARFGWKPGMQLFAPEVVR